jgi:hypothetical protein
MYIGITSGIGNNELLVWVNQEGFLFSLACGCIFFFFGTKFCGGGGEVGIKGIKTNTVDYS